MRNTGKSRLGSCTPQERSVSARRPAIIYDLAGGAQGAGGCPGDRTFMSTSMCLPHVGPSGASQPCGNAVLPRVWNNREFAYPRLWEHFKFANVMQGERQLVVGATDSWGGDASQALR